MQDLMLVIAFGLMIFVLLLHRLFGQGAAASLLARDYPPKKGELIDIGSLLDEPATPDATPANDASSNAALPLAVILPPPRRDRLAEGGPKLLRPLRKALPIDKQPLIVIGFRPGEDAIEITLPREDMAEARRLSLTPDIRPDPRGGCVVRLGGVTVARVHSAVIGQRDVILREEVAA